MPLLLPVIHVQEKQSLRRRGHAAQGAVARSENLRRPLGRVLAAADGDEGARDISNHVVEEAIAGDLDMEMIGAMNSLRQDDKLMHGADGVFPL